MQGQPKRALISVFDKRGVVEFGRGLVELGYEVVSSGGTARALGEAGIAVRTVSQETGFPEMLGGRVKTLHPRIHGGILAVRDEAQHMADLEANSIQPIDLVAVNLYPFERTAATPGISRGEVIEMIDIGGPAMVRAAAKNHRDVGVVVDPEDYTAILDELRESGKLAQATRLRLAVKAFDHTAGYDRAVCGYLSEQAASDGDTPFADQLSVGFSKAQDLRYGENPHQRAAFYRDPAPSGPSLASAEQLQGKELSFNNILDLDAALNVVADLKLGGCAIIKHGNPCGAATGSTPREAFDAALACDSVSAFGGVIAFNRPVDLLAAEAMAGMFVEAIIAPSFDDEARERFAKKKALRLLEVGDLSAFRRSGMDLRRVCGGLLVQDWDDTAHSLGEERVVTRRQPSDAEWAGLRFAWVVARHVKSNAIVFASSDRTLGIGAGQMSRVDSSKIAIRKAGEAGLSLKGAVMASDAFFPFRDGLDVAAEAGIRAVVQPGGSKRDDEVVAAADEHDMAMVFTGQRHFRH